MAAIDRNKTMYWILTALSVVPTAGSGILELFTNGPESVVQNIQSLGYPLYVLRILGLAKVLGAIAILSGRSPRLKEWAYAGFTFDFLGATASYLLVGNTAQAPIPFLFFALLMGSYLFWNRSTALRAS